MEKKAQRLLTTAQAAERISLAHRTLEADRSERRYGIPYIKIGHSVRYREEDILQFTDQKRIVPSQYE